MPDAHVLSDPLPPSFATPPIPQFMPGSGIEGQTIVLNGQNFNFTPVSVDFDDVAATVVGTPTATQVAVVVPNNLTAAGDAPRDVQIKVTTAGGSVVSDRTFCITGPRYDVPPPSFAAPPIPEFLPKSGIGGQTITLHGQNFDRAPVLVKFDDADASLVGPPTATQIVVAVPNNSIAAGGAPSGVKLEVTTAGGTVVSTGIFTITRPYPDSPPPSFAVPPLPQFSPRSGVAGQSILLNGHNFRSAPVSVKFAGTDAIVVGVPTATQIVTIVPANMIPDGGGAQGAKITVTTAGGSVVSDDIFSVIAR